MKSAFFGTLSFDTISLPGTKPMRMVGGSALYGSLASALFCKTVALSVVGSDYPKSTIKLMQKHGVDTSLLQSSEKPAFSWDVEYMSDLATARTLNRSFNSFSDFDPTRLKSKLNDIESIYVGKNDPAIQNALFKLVPKSAVQIMSTRANWITNKRSEVLDALKLADIFLLHDEELKLLVGSNLSLPEKIERVMSYGPRVVVLMRNEYGLVMYGRMGTMVVPSYPLAFAVDPTGAGDAFGGAMAGVLACLGKLTPDAMRKALVLASTVASYVVEDYGTASLEGLTQKQIKNRANLFLNQLPGARDIIEDPLE